MAGLLCGSGRWAPVTIPHYGGPIGRAAAWYRTTFQLPAVGRGQVLILRFEGVDYGAAVYVNGTLVGTHEGFFAPFECEVTAAVAPGRRNTLLVRVTNDAVCGGNTSWGQPVDGDKLYAATGLGWDDPELGWHHCPPGMGIHGPVRLEVRPSLHVRSVWARPLPDEGIAEIRAEVFNSATTAVPITAVVSVWGHNFHATVCRNRLMPALQAAGPGLNFYMFPIPMRRHRRWDLDAPWLYEAQVTVRVQATGRPDTVACTFGMRRFVQDTQTAPRGRFYLNGRPVRLRGANTMGHEQQCVLRGDMAELRDDILLAKLANLNFLRLTQRPVQREVYDMCDRLGMLTQTDLPLFGYLRRNQFAEAVRQAGEMECHVRPHPCNVVVTFINEPFPAAWSDKRHRHLNRAELEAFFSAAAAQVRVCNPDRVIKPVDGDYDPPAEGLPDSHCYTAWYVGHHVDLGRLHAGHWGPVKAGWLHGCGEFGAEGLDPAALMRRRYPRDWLPWTPAEERAWTPSRILKAQTGDIGYAWCDRHQRLGDWVRDSQAYQAWATRFQAEAFRRDRNLVSMAIHLFIDAFPAGWMKAIMDCERRPKPAYFAYRRALAPLAVQLRADRWQWFGGETITADAWVCNDTTTVPERARVVVQFERQGLVVYAAEIPARVAPDDAVCQGALRFRLPCVKEREAWTGRIALRGSNGRLLAANDLQFTVFPRTAVDTACHRQRAALWVQKRSEGAAAQLARALQLRVIHWAELDHADVILLDCAPPAHELVRVRAAVKRGAKALLLEWPPGTYDIAGGSLSIVPTGMGAYYFASRATGHPLVAGFKPRDFWLWHDAVSGLFAPLLFSVARAADWTPILCTGNGGWGAEWQPALAAAERREGAGAWRIVQVRLRDRVDSNPVALEFARRLVQG